MPLATSSEKPISVNLNKVEKQTQDVVWGTASAATVALTATESTSAIVDLDAIYEGAIAVSLINSSTAAATAATAKLQCSTQPATAATTSHIWVSILDVTGSTSNSVTISDGKAIPRGYRSARVAAGGNTTTTAMASISAVVRI